MIRFTSILTLSLVAAFSFALSLSANAATRDHYQCYAVVKAGSFSPITVRLRDQFGKSSAVVLRPISVCAPVHKNGSLVRDEVTHLVCYAIGSPVTDVNKTVRVRNQFGTIRLDLGAAIALCLPSTKEVID